MRTGLGQSSVTVKKNCEEIDMFISGKAMAMVAVGMGWAVPARAQRDCWLTNRPVGYNQTKNH
jgi:hypothetical protein